MKKQKVFDVFSIILTIILVVFAMIAHFYQKYEQEMIYLAWAILMRLNQIK